MGPTPHRPVQTLARAAGLVLGAATSAIRLLRRRPLHPHGVRLVGTLQPVAGRAPSGLAWFDGLTGPVPVEARLSRGAGLPAPLPDVVGIALQLHGSDGQQVHLLAASTGRGALGRFLLVPRRSASGVFLSTLMPFRGGSGPVVLALETDPEPALPSDPADIARALEGWSWRLRLLHGGMRGGWHPLADVVLTHPPRGSVDTGRRSDPLLFAPPGDTIYPWARALRRPAYRAARAGAPLPEGAA